MKKILFICTSNKDRSPALQRYFAEHYPDNYYRSAGINQFNCKLNKTHYILPQDIFWADVIVYAEDVHKRIMDLLYGDDTPSFVILNAGEFDKNKPLNYLIKAEEILLNANILP
jgi:predicted protein tyrosine phosphatase